MGDILKPLRKSIKKYKLASFDVETYGVNNDFYLVGLMWGDRYECFYNVDVFYNFIKLRLKDYYIVATNLSFDLTACFLNSKYWEEFNIISNGGFMLMAENETLGIKFIDTLSYHKASLEELGKIINCPKSNKPSFLGEVPKNPIEEKELRDYNEQDCLISLSFLEWFQNQINNLGGELKITIASCSIDIWKRKYNNMVICKEDYILKKRGIDVNIKDKIFKAYYGGRTEVLKRGYVENLYYYDFNSLYPSVMLNELPLPNSVQYFKSGSLAEIMNREGVSHVKVINDTNELPLLPYRDGKLIFPKGEFKGWYTHIELRTALKHGYTVLKVYETISYSLMITPFARFVDDMFNKRKQAKKKADSSQLIFKLIMNALYGKFGERRHNKTVHFDLSKMDKIETEKLQNEHFENNVSINSSGKGYYTEEEECTSNHVLPIWPVYVTALARIKLWEKARLLDPYYMDTDSIITKELLPSSKELGELELEYHIDRGIFIKPKMYYFKDGDKEIVRLKGVPRINIEQFKKILAGESVRYTKFVKLKEGIRRNINVNSMIEIEKHINLEDNKRIWNQQFSINLVSSTPLVVSGK